MVRRQDEVLEQEIAPVSPDLPDKGGAVGIQVETARRFPRSVTTFIRRATEMATLNPEVAASCVYALPRGGKTIEGPSARLAEIVASAWGNLRVQAGATDADDRYITARGEAWDVETNVAIGFEVRRRITNKRGETYDDDMITVTGNAAASIALRNAVFKAVPSAFWRPVYQKCRQVVAGDARTFGSRRDEMLKAFAVAGVTAERLCAGIGLRGVQDITLDHMATLAGVLTALREGDTTIEDAFPDSGGVGPQPAQRKSQQAQPNGAEGSQQREARSREMPSVATGPVGGSAAPASQSSAAATSGPRSGDPAWVGVIESVTLVSKEGGPPSWFVRLNTGFVCGTRDADMAKAAEINRDAKRLVELDTTAATDPKFKPRLDSIQPLEVAP